jgi:hypothetical protein
VTFIIDRMRWPKGDEDAVTGKVMLFEIELRQVAGL